MDLVRDPRTGDFAEAYLPKGSHFDLYRRLGLKPCGTRIVAIVDSGLLSDHPLIRSRIVDAVDFTGEGVEDTYGHGTLVALNLLARFPVEAAPDLLNVKVIYSDGRSGPEELIAGLDWIAAYKRQHSDCLIEANLSLGYERHRLFRSAGCDGRCNVCAAAI